MLCLPATCRAQATSTASRSLDLAAFGGYTGARPDYGPYHDQGMGFGIDVTRYFHLPIVPSLEGRGNFLSGTAVSQKTFLVGLRAEYPLGHRLHPYANFLVGAGTMHFKFIPGYTSDNSTVYSYGGGIDVDIVHNIQLKVDGQYQSWNLGKSGGNPNGPFTLTPEVLLFGVEYHIPFRPLNKQRDFYR
jgi:opacity protein-like surface antigen